MFWTFKFYFLLSKIRTLVTGKTSSRSVRHASVQNVDPSNLANSHLLSWRPITECPLLRSPLYRSHVYDDMLHVCAICHRTEISTGNIHSLPCGGAVHMFVGISLCIYTFGGPPVWFGPGDSCKRFTGVNVCHMLKDEQVNNEIMLKEAWIQYPHTCIHRFCCVGPSVPLAERVNPRM